MATQKQIDANRRNAQRSTGPKTPAGLLETLPPHTHRGPRLPGQVHRQPPGHRPVRTLLGTR